MFTSSKKVADLFTEIDEQMSNVYGDSTKLSWVNEVEQYLYNEEIEDYTEHVFTVATAASDVPVSLSYTESGTTVSFLFEHIRKVEIKHGTAQYNEYSSTSLAYIPPYSYYKANEKLGYSDPKNGDSVKVIFRRIPPMKLIGNISADYLSLPNRFLKIYKYYIFAQILLLKKEYVESNNWITFYNAEIEDFKKWYLENKPSYGG